MSKNAGFHCLLKIYKMFKLIHACHISKGGISVLQLGITPAPVKYLIRCIHIFSFHYGVLQKDKPLQLKSPTLDYMFDIQVGQYIFLYDSEGRMSHITLERRNINLKYV